MRSYLLPRLSIAVALLAVVTTLALSASSRPAEALTNCTVSNLSVDAEEAQFLQLINAYRPSGTPDLTISVNLNRAASWMAVDLATRSDGVFSHTDSLGRSASTRGTQCDGTQYFGENIAAGGSRATAQAAFNAWQTSSRSQHEHAQQQLPPDRYRAILQLRVSSYDWYWVTIFSTLERWHLDKPGLLNAHANGHAIADAVAHTDAVAVAHRPLLLRARRRQS